jgi:hypothetical protein
MNMTSSMTGGGSFCRRSRFLVAGLAVTLMSVSSRKKARKNKVRRQGISGDPRRRAEQLGRGRPAGLDPVADEMLYSLAGGASPAPWWAASHERVLARVREFPSSAPLEEVEERTCRVVGDEFWGCLQSENAGFHPAQWLRVLAEKAGGELRSALAREDEWQGLWAFLCGLALTAPRTPRDALSESMQKSREMFPDIREPYDVAMAEVGRMAGLMADRGLEPGLRYPVGGFRPVGDPLVGCDVYGSRIVVMAPYGDLSAASHWYAWDIDRCWIDYVVGAGTFASAEDALREWQGVVGAPAARTTLSACDPAAVERLLAPCLETGPMAEMLQGGEPRELIREYFRLRRRARELVEATGGGEGDAFSLDLTGQRDAFLAWYAKQHDDVPEAEDAGTIVSEWGPHRHPGERSLYGCSPHRIQMTAHLIRDGYREEYADAALKLLPDWVEWCIERTRLDEAAADRSREAARRAIATAADVDGEPFRRHE